ncbi:2-oxo acid dehydrogenase subunit E2 [Spiroplasma alleghenense]|uniref:Dihydrolipoamide acetyltransferase component of pyruvate dehydrogenase complex n=1 Tax=Spiroplasma alleghenense TaxID=216931 RepID=A0A345Z3Z8_9MOLU|nr:2-oxo acid dehydrogenase subunit E2 [Spiroplasma alleghenense]AXK51327.1 hypothetical protein SALLE_v1c06570 [Spiroplasma alleghenense]
MNRIKFKTSSNLKGIVEKVYVLDGDIVKKGQVISKISTQLETFDVIAHVNGVIKNINILESLIVSNGDIIFDIFNEQEVKNIHSVKSVGRSLKDVITENPRYNQPKYDSRDHDIYENAQTMTMEIAEESGQSIIVETVNMQTKPSTPLKTTVREIILEEQLSNNWTDEISKSEENVLDRTRFDQVTTGFDNLTQELDIIGNVIDKRLEDFDNTSIGESTSTVFDGENFNVPASSFISTLDKTDKILINSDEILDSSIETDLKNLAEETQDFDLLYEKTQILENAESAELIEIDILEDEGQTVIDKKLDKNDLNNKNFETQETNLYAQDGINFLTWDELKENLLEESLNKTLTEELDFIEPENQKEIELLQEDTSSNLELNPKKIKNISEIKKELAKELAETETPNVEIKQEEKDLKSNIDLTIREFNFLTKDSPKKVVPANASKKGYPIKKTKANTSFGQQNYLSNSTIDLEVDLTSLSNLYDLMSHPFMEKGLELSLMTFFIKAVMKAWNKVLQKNGLHLKEEEKVIKYSLFSKKEMVLPTINVSLNEEINEIAKMLTEQKQEFQFGNDYPENRNCQISIIDFGSLNLNRGNWQLKPGELFAIGVGNIIQKPISENNSIFVKNMVNITMTFNNKTINLVEANQILQEFAKLIINPGLLI